MGHPEHVPTTYMGVDKLASQDARRFQGLGPEGGGVLREEKVEGKPHDVSSSSSSSSSSSNSSCQVISEIIMQYLWKFPCVFLSCLCFCSHELWQAGQPDAPLRLAVLRRHAHQVAHLRAHGQIGLIAVAVAVAAVTIVVSRSYCCRSCSFCCCCLLLLSLLPLLLLLLLLLL